ncbi:MAG: 30S ribosomal protein S18 [Candidatus Aminicenantes bacterium 4484_214]|nr:MAG: 30S ribosomal protein S18 [Candidatus Aminicenantes bacterium 4484_214]RLE09028.1 MAG: 30S ribosomal protein S18 [Candidatus Aminicenantes bacterium]HDJ23479.1 30S ribosomal protein S18 [Candidatus Aminicenantes bacterium]
MSRESRSSDRPTYRRFFTPKKKVCRFCELNVRDIDYKNVELLRKYTPERGKIAPRRLTGTCSYHQRRLSRAVKRARILGLLPFVAD